MNDLIYQLPGLMTLAQHGGAAATGGAPTMVNGTLPGWAGLIPMLPLLGCVLCTLCAVFRVRTKLPAAITVGCLGAAFALAFLMYRETAGGAHAQTAVVKLWDWIRFSYGYERPTGSGFANQAAGYAHEVVANFSFYVDPLTCLWMLFVTGLATLIALYASEYMSHDLGAGYNRFYVAFNLFVFSMACLVMGDNLLLLFLGWEGVGLCSYLLIGYFYTKPSAVAAAKKAFVMNRIGDLGLSMGIMLTFVKFGTLEYATLFASPELAGYIEAARAGRWEDIPLTVQLIPILLTVGAFGKSAQLPLYVWLPDAMEGPTPVSALIHAATMVTAGVYLIARFFPVFQASEHALAIVAWGGTLTAFLAATIGMAQFDIKRIMAYSTVSQLGYMFAGLGVMTSVGAAWHVFTHAFFKALLFLACGAVMHGFAGQLDLRKLSGVMKMKGWGIVGLGMLVGCLNLSGFPFTAGFFSKDTILADAFIERPMVGWLLLLTAGLTAYYTFRVFFRVFVGPEHFEPGDEGHGGGDHEHHGTDDHPDAHHASAGRHGAAHHHGPEAHAQGTRAEAALATVGTSAHETNADEERALAAHADAHGHGPAHEGGHFHPHPPGWAINLVLGTLAALSLLAVVTAFTHPPFVKDLVQHSTAAMAEAAHGAADHAHGAADAHGHAHAGVDAHAGHHHGDFLGMDPHKVMYYVSAIVGLIGILAAAFLHGPRGIGGLMLGSRTGADRSRADGLLPVMGPLARGAQRKWYVDEIYDAAIVRPLWYLSHLLFAIDRFLVDGLVNAFGWLPRGAGSAARRAQSGVLHDYALRMAFGLTVVVMIVLLVKGGGLI